MAPRKPVDRLCASCGTPLTQPATGRPKRFCDGSCRQQGVLAVRRANSLLLTAERNLQAVRAKAAVRPWHDDPALKFWTREVARLNADLAELLADDGTASP